MWDIDRSRVMILAPHLDDEVLGCSGTILKYRETIDYLSIVHITGTEQRCREFEQVSVSLMVDSHKCLDFRDGFLKDEADQITLELIRAIQEEKPHYLFMPHRKDQHVDHQALYKIGKDAVEKARYWELGLQEHKVEALFLYEVWSFMEPVSYVVDITRQFEEKQRLLSHYQSQMSFPYMEYSETISAYRGLVHNRGGKAEAFQRICI